MCGIVGYVGARPCEELLLSGLEKLEYRGYDSAGLSVLADGEVESVHAVGNLANLRAAVEARANNGAGALPPAETGIAHTRWATHGRVTEANAHPHDDSSGRRCTIDVTNRAAASRTKARTSPRRPTPRSSLT